MCIVYDKLLKPRQSFRITPYLWILSSEHDLCRPYGAYNFEVAARFLENLCIPGGNKNALTIDTGLFHVIKATAVRSQPFASISCRD